MGRTQGGYRIHAVSSNHRGVVVYDYQDGGRLEEFTPWIGEMNELDGLVAAVENYCSIKMPWARVEYPTTSFDDPE